jgi:hypothetical protein
VFIREGYEDSMGADDEVASQILRNSSRKSGVQPACCACSR